MKKLLFFVISLLSLNAIAQIAERPSPARLYNNLSKEFPDFLSADEAAQLEEKLEVFSNSTSNQICVVVVDDLGGYDASEYAIKLGNEWGVGKKGANNGIVILIKPTGGKGQRALFISVGYGLEGAIPDLATRRIREEEMNPYLKERKFYTALDRGTDVLMKLAKGEINVEDYNRNNGSEGGVGTIILIIIIVIIILTIIKRGGGGGRGYTFGRGGRTYWGAGGWGGFGGGSWGGGGSSSGGGWGGFGGGSFGGGGSGGSW